MARRNPNDVDDDERDEREEEESEEEESEEEESEEEESEEEESEEEESEEEESEEEESEEEESEDLDPDDLERLINSGKTVPYPRVQQLVARNHELTEALLRTLGTQNGSAAKKDEPPPFDLKAKRTELRAAILEDDQAKAEALETEIDEYQERKAAIAASNAAVAAVQQADAQRAGEAIVKRYPLLARASDPDDVEANEALEDVLAVRNRLVENGWAPAAAIREAADRICGRRRDAAPQPKGGKNGAGTKTRQQLEKLRNSARAARGQAPDQGRLPNSRSGESRVTEKAVLDMSQDRYERLSPRERRRLLGEE